MDKLLIQNKQLLIKEHGNACFLGDIINAYNVLTAHHDNPRRLGGTSEIENLYLLSRLMHDAVHIMETNDLILFKSIRDFLHYWKYEDKDVNVQDEMRGRVWVRLDELGFKVDRTKDQHLMLKRDKRWYSGKEIHSH